MYGRGFTANEFSFPATFEKVLAKRGLKMVVGRDGVGAVSSLDYVSRLFFAPGRVVLALGNVQFSELRTETIYSADTGGIFLHLRRRSSYGVAFYFEGFSPEGVESIRVELLRRFPKYENRMDARTLTLMPALAFAQRAPGRGSSCPALPSVKDPDLGAAVFDGGGRRIFRPAVFFRRAMTSASTFIAACR